MLIETGTQPTTRPARLLIVDDHDLARAGLACLLTAEPDLEIVGEASTARQALALCQRLRPDLVLMDIRLPDLDGIAATRSLKQQCPDTRVVIVTMQENPDYLLEALRAGAVGYVLKGATRQEVISTIRKVLDGQPIMQPELATQLLRRLTGGQGLEALSTIELLTLRERDVLRLVAEGQTNQEIGDRLTLSLSTIKTHVEHILTKLDVCDRTQAAVRAAELGLLAASAD